MKDMKEHPVHEHKHEVKKEEVVEIPVGKFINKLRNNLWIVSTFVLAIVLVVVLIMNNGGSGGSAVSADIAAKSVLSFINNNPNLQSQVTLAKSEKDGQLYKITLNYQGQEVPLYATLDGKFLVNSIVPLSDDANDTGADQNPQPAPTPKDISKSDKPKVELFIMSYCPYGTQMEKAILPVVAALKNKIDFKLEFTHFTLHGEKEDTENFRQMCIREEQGAKFLPYLQCILNSTNPSVPADVSLCMKNLKIDATKVDSCIKGKAKDYYAADSALSQKYQVQGSPTLVINGAQVDSPRSPDGILKTICSAFNNAPSECNVQLSTQSASPGFGYSASNSADSAAVKCQV